MPIPKGTVSIMLNTKKRANTFTLAKSKEEISKKSKFKMKWKTVQWLVRNKREAVLNISRNGKLIFRKFCTQSRNVC